jgi:hypothetical protein
MVLGEKQDYRQFRAYPAEVAMRSHHVIFASALIAPLLATPLVGQPQNVCLQSKDVASWKAIDENTIVFIDRQGQNYTFKFTDTCPSGAYNPSIVHRSMKASGCVAHGDHIDVRAGGPWPPPVCVVESVTAGAPSGLPLAGAAGGLSKKSP